VGGWCGAKALGRSGEREREREREMLIMFPDLEPYKSHGGRGGPLPNLATEVRLTRLPRNLFLRRSPGATSDGKVLEKKEDPEILQAPDPGSLEHVRYPRGQNQGRFGGRRWWLEENLAVWRMEP